MTDSCHSESPVQMPHVSDDAVAHSLGLLATVYHYNHWIFDSLRDFIGPRVLEVGAGVGNITQFLLNADQVVCLEPFEPYHKYLTWRFRDHLNVKTHLLPIEQVPGPDVPAKSFDTVLCINVLEHIADDVGALRRMRELTAPGGRVVVFVPALPALHGVLDQAMGHCRRYTKRSLRQAFVAAGLRPERGRYMNLIGAPAWWWASRVVKKTALSESATRFFDRLVPFLSAFERIVRPIVGQSVYVVGRA